MKHRLFLFITIFLSFSLLVPSAYAWANNTFVSRLAIDVTNNDASNTLKQILVPVYYKTEMNMDFSDLRVYNETDDEQLWFTIYNQSNSGLAQLWVNFTLDAGKTGKFYIYYENNSVLEANSSYENASRVFTYWDSFEYADNIINHGWTDTGEADLGVPNDTINTSGGNKTMRLGTNSSADRLRADRTFNCGVPGCIMTVDFYDNGGSGSTEWWNVGDLNQMAVGVHDADDTTYWYWTDVEDTKADSGIARTIDWHTANFTFDGSSTTVALDGTNLTTKSFILNQIQFFSAGTPYVQDWYADRWLVRNYTSIDPTVDITTESINELNNCTSGSSPNTRAFIFKTKNETDRLPVNNVTLDITFTLNDTSQYNFTFNQNNDTYEICQYPTWMNTKTNATMRYVADGYSTRTYYLVNASVSNATQTVDLYLLKKELSYLGCSSVPCTTKFTVKDNAGTTQSNVYVKIQKYYIDFNLYATVTILKTSANGEALTFLEPETVLYRYILEKGNQVLETIEEFPLSSNDITLIIQPSGLIEYFKYNNQVASLCTFDNATEIISCTFSDTTGTVSQNCLKVEQVGRISTYPFYEECDTSSGSTLSTTLVNSANRTYLYEAYIVRSGEQIIVAQGLIEALPYSVYGLSGLLITFLAVLGISLTGIWNKKIALILALITLGVFQIIGVIAMNYQQFSLLLFAGILLLIVLIRRS